MASQRWTVGNKSVYNVAYHLIWCTKYRRGVLHSVEERRLKELLLKKSEEISVIIKEMEIMPDHVHLFVKCSPVASPHWVVQQFKGYTSRTMRKEFKHLTTRIPSLWTRSYFCESVGHISENTVRSYIAGQKGV